MADNLTKTIEAAQTGEKSALEELVDAYGPRVYGYLYRLLDDRQEAEDLLQDVFVRLVRGIGSYKHRENFDAWIFRIATNLVRDRVRRRQRRPVFVATDDDIEPRAPLLGLRDSSPNPSETMERHEEIDRLGRALNRLSDDEREVIVLRHFSQLSFKEIAGLLGAPVGTVLAKAHRTLAKLRKLMEAAEGHEHPTTSTSTA
jgi:RNA polymerase sigma-70 factor (ECF subfamily)